MSFYVYAHASDNRIPFDEVLPDGRPFQRNIQKHMDFWNPYAQVKSMDNVTVSLAVASKLKRNPHPYIAEIYRVGVDYFDSEVINVDVHWSNALIDQVIAMMAVVKDHLQSLGIYLMHWEPSQFGEDKDRNIKFYSESFDTSRFLGYDSTESWMLKDLKPDLFSNLKELDDAVFDKCVKELL